MITAEPIFANNARSLWRAGVSVIPLGGADGKRPSEYRFMRYSERIASETTLRRWERDKPDANVGILAGAISGLTVVDIDTKAVTEAEAPALIELALSEFGEPRVVAATPSGGQHFYYQHNGERGRNKLHGLPIDIRGEGLALVVAPPSRRPHAGVYRFIQGGIDDLDRLHPAKPGSIPEQHLRRHQSLQTGKEWAAMHDGDGRNDAFLKKALYLISAHGPDRGRELALAANLEFAEPLSIVEAEKTIASAAKMEASGRNFFLRPALPIPYDELKVLQPHAPAFVLWTVILENHFDRAEFALAADAMARDGVIDGWCRTQYRNATSALLDLGFIELVHEGTGRGNPNKYAIRHKWP